MVANLFFQIPAESGAEVIEVLEQAKSVRIERIVSRGHASPIDFWYDQPEHEWVTVLAGSGTLLFQEPEETVKLNVGDYMLIPAHRKHRVQATDPNCETIWLALFYRD